MYFHVYLIYRFTRTFTDHSSVITRCWGFELQNGKSSLKSQQTLATQDFAPASFLSTPDKRTAVSRFYGLQRFLLSYLLSGAAAPSVYFLLQQDISQGLERSDLADTGVCFWVFQNDPGTGVEKQQHEHRAAVLLPQHLHESRGAHVWLVSRGCRCGLH